jgi:hypothetical protein
MPNHPTTTGTGPWRILVLDRDPPTRNGSWPP